GHALAAATSRCPQHHWWCDGNRYVFGRLLRSGPGRSAWHWTFGAAFCSVCSFSIGCIGRFGRYRLWLLVGLHALLAREERSNSGEAGLGLTSAEEPILFRRDLFVLNFGHSRNAFENRRVDRRMGHCRFWCPRAAWND